MITKTISNIQPQQMQMVLSNLCMGFTINSRSSTSVTATGPQEYWEMVSLPSDAVVTAT